MTAPIVVRSNGKLAEMRRTFAERRTDFYRTHGERILVDEVNYAIADRQSPSRDTILRYFTIGNQRVAALVNEYEKHLGGIKLPDPNAGNYREGVPGDYGMAIKACVDARALVLTVIDMIQRPIIHELTAGAIVRKGHVFKVLGESGVGLVITHQMCGAEVAAHDFYTGRLDVNGDTHIHEVVRGISQVVAEEPNANLRTILNAVHQAIAGGTVLERARLGNDVFPLTYEFDEKGGATLVWRSRTKNRESPLLAALRENVEMLWKLAREAKRSPQKQFAHTVLVYDPYRLRRFNDPRAMLDVLPNEVFAVTFNYKRVLDGRPCNSVALGSVEYATSHGGTGHVSGVGGKNGNRHIMVIDTDVNMINRVVEKMLADSPGLKEVTKNGATITKARFDLKTRTFEFLTD